MTLPRTHRETLVWLADGPREARDAPRGAGSMTLCKLVQRGLIETLPGGLVQITQAGREVLSADPE